MLDYKTEKNLDQETTIENYRNNRKEIKAQEKKDSSKNKNTDAPVFAPSFIPYKYDDSVQPVPTPCYEKYSVPFFLSVLSLLQFS